MCGRKEGRKVGRKTHGGLGNMIECVSDSGSLPDELCAAVEVWEHLISSAAVMASSTDVHTSPGEPSSGQIRSATGLLFQYLARRRFSASAAAAARAKLFCPSVVCERRPHFPAEPSPPSVCGLSFVIVSFIYFSLCRPPRPPSPIL